MEKSFKLYTCKGVKSITSRIVKFLDDNAIPYLVVFPKEISVSLSVYPTLSLLMDEHEVWRFESRYGTEPLASVLDGWIDPASVFNEDLAPELIVDTGTIREKTQQEKDDFFRPFREQEIENTFRNKLPLVEVVILQNRILVQLLSIVKKLADGVAIPQTELDNFNLIVDELTGRQAEIIYPVKVRKRIGKAARKARRFVDNRRKALDDIGAE